MLNQRRAAANQSAWPRQSGGDFASRQRARVRSQDWTLPGNVEHTKPLSRAQHGLHLSAERVCAALLPRLKVHANVAKKSLCAYVSFSLLLATPTCAIAPQTRGPVAGGASAPLLLIGHPIDELKTHSPPIVSRCDFLQPNRKHLWSTLRCPHTKPPSLRPSHSCS